MVWRAISAWLRRARGAARETAEWRFGMKLRRTMDPSHWRSVSVVCPRLVSPLFSTSEFSRKSLKNLAPRAGAEVARKARIYWAFCIGARV